MSGKWFHFRDPPKVADSFPGNKIVQGLSNFDSFHWLTTIRATPQDTEMEQMSRHTVFPWALLQQGMCSHFIHSVPGQGNSSRTSYPTPAAPKSCSTGMRRRKSIQCAGLLLHPAAGKHSAQTDAWRLDLDSSSLEIRAANCRAI